MEEKHLPFHNFLEACREDGCPVCGLIGREMRKYFESVLYEEVNNVFFRAKLRHDGGFCGQHATGLLEHKDALGTAIIGRELLATTVEELETGPRRLWSFKKEKHPCLACRVEEDALKRYLGVMRDNLGNEKFKAGVLGSTGLCIPHFQAAQRGIRQLPAWFKEFQHKQLADLAQRLDRFIDSYNDSLGDKRPVIEGKDKTVWQRAMRMLYGRE